MHPSLQESVSKHKHAQKVNYDRTCRERELGLNESVYVRNFGRGEKWVPGKIVECTGPVSYKVRTNDNVIVRRHADHVKVTCAEQECGSVPSNRSDRPTPTFQSAPLPVSDDLSEPKSPCNTNINSGITNSQSKPPDPNGQGLGSPIQQSLRRSNRSIKPPSKLDL